MEIVIVFTKAICLKSLKFYLFDIDLLSVFQEENLRNIFYFIIRIPAIS